MFDYYISTYYKYVKNKAEMIYYKKPQGNLWLL